LNVTFDNFSQQVDVNLKSNFFLAQEFIKYLLNNKAEGSLLFISSETAGKCNDLPYGLTKVAINSLVGGIARRVYQKGIRVNAIAPGVTFTDMTKGNHHIDDDYSNNSVAGRYFLPEEIAEVAVFVLSDVSKCITGEVLYCDAGSHLKINGTETEYSL
jgi:NAD(P)-dependent dehydrogenase (short-subunit alcohol dehydrogenase family)